jgi:endonuclease YncB( thermonuclease family)
LILLLTAALGAGQPFTCVPAQVWDGDTFTCADGTKVRVAAVAAREGKRVKGSMIDGGSSVGHPCPTYDGVRARDRLVEMLGRPQGTGQHGHVLLRAGPIRCVSSGSAGRGRVGAWCKTAKGVDISCTMVRRGYALRWSNFDLKRQLCRK